MGVSPHPCFPLPRKQTFDILVNKNTKELILQHFSAFSRGTIAEPMHKKRSRPGMKNGLATCVASPLCLSCNLRAILDHKCLVELTV
jgi:hypothetical protein